METWIDLFFPPECVNCRSEQGKMLIPTLCDICWQKLYSPNVVRIPDSDSFAYPCGDYIGPLRELIVRAKYKRERLPMPALKRMIQSGFRQVLHPDFDAIVYVPAVRKRLQQRGFHFTADLAKSVSRTSGIPLRPKWLTRLRETPAQQTLDRKRRLENIRGAFSASNHVAEKKVLVVDDVFTTGTTASEITKTLTMAGAVHVTFLVLARTPNFC